MYGGRFVFDPHQVLATPACRVQGCATCLQPGRPEDRGSISGGDKHCFSAPYVETDPGTQTQSGCHSRGSSGRSVWLAAYLCSVSRFNPLNPELNPICYLLALLGAHNFLHVSRIRVKSLTFRRLMSYIYIWSTHS